MLSFLGQPDTSSNQNLVLRSLHVSSEPLFEIQACFKYKYTVRASLEVFSHVVLSAKFWNIGRIFTFLRTDKLSGGMNQISYNVFLKRIVSGCPA
jgi:hypothetical protein